MFNLKSLKWPASDNSVCELLTVMDVFFRYVCRYVDEMFIISIG